MLRAPDTGPHSAAADDRWPADGLEWLGRCPVCGSAARGDLYEDLRDRVFFCAPGQWTMYQCRRCALAYLDPRPNAQTISRAYTSYFTHHPCERAAPESMTVVRRWQRALANGYRNWRYGTHERPASRLGVPVVWLMPRLRAALDGGFRHLPKAPSGGRLLDIGCGDGTFLACAARAGWRAEGVDPDPAAVAAARARGLDVTCGTGESLAAAPSSFDVVTLSHVIEHVHDPRALLERVEVLLKPGGLLWLDTPNLDAFGHARFGSSWIGLDAPRHLVVFPRRSIFQLLESVGLRVVRQYSRFEVCAGSFALSHAISNSSRTPLAVRRAPTRVRLQGLLASWLVRLGSHRTEWTTVTAAKRRD